MHSNIHVQTIWHPSSSEVGYAVTLGVPCPDQQHFSAEDGLKIGPHAIIRAFSLIQNKTELGHHIQTGHHVTIKVRNQIGNHVSIGTGSTLHPDNLIEDHCRIHSGCTLGNTWLGTYVFLGPNVIIESNEKQSQQTVLGPFTRIGANSTVLPGVNIGKNCLIGAGSLVTENIPDHSVAAGNPARILKHTHELKCSAGIYERPYIWLEDDPAFQKSMSAPHRSL